MNTNALSRFTRDLARSDHASASAARSREEVRLACIAHIRQTEMRKTDPSGFAWERTFEEACAAYGKTFERNAQTVAKSRPPAAPTAPPAGDAPIETAPAAIAPVPITLTIDNAKEQRWFNTSQVESLRKLTFTEWGLLNEVVRLNPEYTVEQVVREGTQYYAKRLIALAKSADAKSTPRRKGVANKRIAKVYAKMVSDNAKASAAGKPAKSLSASSLAVAAKTNMATAQRFLDNLERTPTVAVVTPAKPAVKKTTTQRKRKSAA